MEQVGVMISVRRGDSDDDAYLERTAVRLRHMASTHSAVRDADADKVHDRLRNMTYGSSRQLHTQVLTTT